MEKKIEKSPSVCKLQHKPSANLWVTLAHDLRWSVIPIPTTGPSLHTHTQKKWILLYISDFDNYQIFKMSTLFTPLAMQERGHIFHTFFLNCRENS